MKIDPATVKLGKRPARRDARISRLSAVAPGLPPPPTSANWYADVPDWLMLGNDKVGDCVQAAILHLILLMSSYVSPGAAPLPTEAEAIAFYSAATGYDPAQTDTAGNNPTDRGSYVVGPGGVLEHWTKTGIFCGGVPNKPLAFVQITRPHPAEWQTAISLFGGLLVGLMLPEAIVAGETVPDVWSITSGPVAGGHEVLLVGYEKTEYRTTYELISWGQRYKATERFLLHCLDEAVAVCDPAFFNASGIDPAGIDRATLLADMGKIQC